MYMFGQLRPLTGLRQMPGTSRFTVCFSVIFFVALIVLFCGAFAVAFVFGWVVNNQVLCGDSACTGLKLFGKL